MLRRAKIVGHIAQRSLAAPSRFINSPAQVHRYAMPSVFVKWNPQWITEEAERIMAKSYTKHRSLGDFSTIPVKPMNKAELETLGHPYHYPPRTIGDHVAHVAVSALKPIVHLFFKEKYNHHAVVLETVAAVPGMVAGAFRHMRSLRKMTRDNGWIHTLWEEAENERMHLLIWMQCTNPTSLEKALVVAAQAFYGGLYTGLYLLAPGTAHRFVGYLEEEAVAAYTAYLAAIDSGALPNGPAPDIAKKYYNLPADATLRDTVLMVRGDEVMHSCMNHKLGDMMRAGAGDQHHHYPPAEYYVEETAETQTPEPTSSRDLND